MEPAEPTRGTKRPLAGDDDDDAGRERKPRFPKGKKAKHRAAGAEGGPSASASASAAVDIDSMLNPELAAERRARQRHGQPRDGDDAKGGAADIKGFEVHYNDGVNFVDDGIRIEPFNLEREREEGYFDKNGNFVEYARGNEIKDAWLDSVEVDPTYAAKVQKKGKEKVEEFEDLSSDDIGRIKRQIANVLEPGETIMQALKRLKGTSTDKRGKMSEGTKRIFDELTEAAMKLMENGDYNVYSDDRETFEREAAGYERLARARLGLPEVEDASMDTKDNQAPSSILEMNQPSSILEMDLGASTAKISTATAAFNDDDSNLDMFGDDDNDDVKHSSDANIVGSGPNPGSSPQGTLGTSEAGNGSMDSDYVYDPSSGYYYSRSTGYYYDPNSGYYGSASTGTWYSYDEQTGAYKEIQDEQTGIVKEQLGDAIKE
ncbi:CD2 antigen cytoplasmic tail-binding protein 2 homolog isoform X2 [Panicum virgatum]|uniref:CD2 antigen cytoplasmic tail-binding protein 2 homolog isoform X2 n=1 Tax=Panicum virgatum TaxID=38727 RepID=UPI0019D556F1|nr:CD2 antigen cytoplasmic tail-binding protein 2 homolog isoform X2 [Panicum virgatum]